MTKRQALMIAKMLRSEEVRKYLGDRLFCYRDSFGRVSRRVIERGHERTWRRFS